MDKIVYKYFKIKTLRIGLIEKYFAVRASTPEFAKNFVETLLYLQHVENEFVICEVTETTKEEYETINIHN